MFVPTLINFGTAEQHEEWVQRSWDCKVIGTYAQTELGHGTFIRGMETTAIYDTKRREFVIHSPSINAYKVSFEAHLCYGFYKIIFRLGLAVSLIQLIML
jgi:Acyl-coenzyme A oxidase N-terminal